MLHSRAAKSPLLKQIPLVLTPEHGRRCSQGSDCRKAAKMMGSRHHMSSRKTCFHNQVKHLLLKTRGGREEPQTQVEMHGWRWQGSPNCHLSFLPAQSINPVASAVSMEPGVHPAATPCHQALVPKADRLVQLRGDPTEPRRDATAPVRSSRALGTAYFQPNADFQQYLICSRKMSSGQVPESKRDRMFKLLQDRLEEKTLQ